MKGSLLDTARQIWYEIDDLLTRLMNTHDGRELVSRSPASSNWRARRVEASQLPTAPIISGKDARRYKGHWMCRMRVTTWGEEGLTWWWWTAVGRGAGIMWVELESEHRIRTRLLFLGCRSRCIYTLSDSWRACRYDVWQETPCLSVDAGNPTMFSITLAI